MPSLELDPQLTPLQKGDLQFKYPLDSTWNNYVKLSPPSDDDLLNRNDWYDMLYFCNKFAIKFSKDQNFENMKKIASRAERLIKRQVPDFLNSKIHIINWLETNWEFYKNI